MKPLHIASILLACNSGSARRAPGDTRPNIILFFPDTLRAESLSPYGHPLVSTPNMERFAGDAVVFDQAHVQHSQCSPSRAAMITGRYLHVLGHRTQTHLVQPYEENLWAHLKAQGYTTITLGKNDGLAAATFNASFSYWEGDIGVSQGKSPFAFGTAGYYSFAGTAGAANGTDVKANGDLKAVKVRTRDGAFNVVLGVQEGEEAAFRLAHCPA